MANYQTTVTLAAPPAGNVLLPGGSTVITYSVDVGAQAAVAALMSGYVSSATSAPAADGGMIARANINAPSVNQAAGLGAAMALVFGG